MYYYAVYYETIPPSYSSELIEIGSDIQMISYFEHEKRLDDDAMKMALVYYLCEQKIKYDELRITHMNEISEAEYYSHTHYE